MVYLDRIYTKSGDSGETSLGDGSRVSKLHPRIIAYGGVDELNSLLGVCLNSHTDNTADRTMSKQHHDWLKKIQNDLFDVGADLCVPESTEKKTDKQKDDGDQPAPLRVTETQVEQLEKWIDIANEVLPPLTSFVLPGGMAGAGFLHLARSVCRRVELDVINLAEMETVNPQVAIYLNRLSDLLFVLARSANDLGKNDVLWVPGGE